MKRFTDATVRALADGEHRDPGSPLTIRVRTGTRGRVVRFEVRTSERTADGRRRQGRVPIGLYPAVSLATARERAERIVRPGRGGRTFLDAVERWRAHFAPALRAGDVVGRRNLQRARHHSTPATKSEITPR